MLLRIRPMSMRDLMAAMFVWDFRVSREIGAHDSGLNHYAYPEGPVCPALRDHLQASQGWFVQRDGLWHGKLHPQLHWLTRRRLRVIDALRSEFRKADFRRALSHDQSPWRLTPREGAIDMKTGRLWDEAPWNDDLDEQRRESLFWRRMGVQELNCLAGLPEAVGALDFE